MAFRIRDVTVQLMASGLAGGGQPCTVISGVPDRPCNPPSCGGSTGRPAEPPKPGDDKKLPPGGKKRWLGALRTQLRGVLASSAL